MAGPTLGVVVFVKTPGHSPLKTRLAKNIGQKAAEQFFIESVKATEKTLKQFVQLGSVNAYWAVAEEQALEDPLWQNFPQILQVEGGLGDRMAGAYNRLLQQHDFVVLLGADTPHLPLNYLAKTRRALFDGEAKHVLGPTEDGGFYLFASGQHFHLHQWQGPVYSTENTRSEFMAAMQLNNEPLLILPAMFDIDEEEDLKRLKTP